MNEMEMNGMNGINGMEWNGINGNGMKHKKTNKIK
jgi:hypothetical protein